MRIFLKPLIKHLIFLTALLALAGCGQKQEFAQEIAAAIKTKTNEAVPNYFSNKPHWTSLQKFYEKREFTPVWVDRKKLQPRAAEFIEALCNSDELGFQPANYPLKELQAMLANAYQQKHDAKAQELAETDLLLSYLFLTYVEQIANGQLNPKEVAPGWHIKRQSVNSVELLEQFSTKGGLTSQHAALEPSHPDYVALKKALEQYKQIASSGGWAPIQSQGSLKPGAQGATVQQLAKRLAMTGDLAASGIKTVYDDTIRAAVANFQKRHGLESTGLVDKATLNALNVPVEDRITQIELNLDRWRWFPQDLGQRYIFVNIPAFQLYAFDQGKPVLEMPVVVGKEYNDQSTPVFSDNMEYVIFGPYWNVPKGIAQEEILPKVRQDPSYLAQHNYEVVSGEGDNAGVIDPNTIDWSGEGFPYRIRQRPSAENSLGKVKFMFPNNLAVYLHDTPAKHLFAKANRAYSHGCIRVGEPDKLAVYVLNNSEWTLEKVQSTMQSAENRRVNLPQKIPVYLAYFTAFPKDGAVNFREDLYQSDQVGMEKLRARSKGGVENPSCGEFKKYL